MMASNTATGVFSRAPQLLAMMLLASFAVQAVANADESAPPALKVLAARPAPEWNKNFLGAHGWTGADGAYSVQLSPNRVLWLFGDTLMGDVASNKREHTVFINNTIALQEGLTPDAPLRFISGPIKENKPTSWIKPADGRGWFWPQAAALINGHLFLFLPQIDHTGEAGAFGFKQVGQWLAEIDNPQADPQDWHIIQRKIDIASFQQNIERSWGSAILLDGGFVYIYGYQDALRKLGTRSLIVARAPMTTLNDVTTWRFRSHDGWSEHPADCMALAAGLATEFSVTPSPSGAGGVLVYTDSGLSSKILARAAANPWGPWSAPTTVYESPEMAADKGLFTYSAKAHGWAGLKDQLLISYCNNSWEFSRLFSDASVYRPRFVVVTVGR